MSQGLSYLEFANLLEKVSQKIREYKDYLTELDSITGDGDLGITINNGFRAVEETTRLNTGNAGQLLIKAGIAFSTAGSTMGALFGVALMRAGKKIGDQEFIDLKSFSMMVKEMEDSIKEKGKADVGDKTILDALVPARLSLESSVNKKASAEQALEHAYLAASEGAEKTKAIQATHGRSRWLGERTIGSVDPGAVFIGLFFKTIWECYKSRGETTIT